jgi:hypothetical protein
MKTQEVPRTALVQQRLPADAFPPARTGTPQARGRPGSADHQGDRAISTAPSPSRGATRVEPCPERIWWFGVLVGLPMMFTGFTLIISLVGAPFGIPLWAAGLGLMFSPRPCKD